MFTYHRARCRRCGWWGALWDRAEAARREAGRHWDLTDHDTFVATETREG